MVDDARTQRRLHEILETGIGTEGADLLMDRLPQRPVSDFATRDDVQANAILLRGEMAELRGEMAELRAELRSEMNELRTDVRTDLATFKVELQRFVLATNIATMVTLVGLVFAITNG